MAKDEESVIFIIEIFRGDIDKNNWNSDISPPKLKKYIRKENNIQQIKLLPDDTCVTVLKQFIKDKLKQLHTLQWIEIFQSFTGQLL